MAAKKKRKKKKKSVAWKVPPVAKNDQELNAQLSSIISFAAAAKQTNNQKRYDISFEFAERVYEVIKVVLKGMEELEPL